MGVRVHLAGDVQSFRLETCAQWVILAIGAVAGEDLAELAELGRGYRRIPVETLEGTERESVECSQIAEVGEAFYAEELEQLLGAVGVSIGLIATGERVGRKDLVNPSNGCLDRLTAVGRGSASDGVKVSGNSSTAVTTALDAMAP